MAKLNKSVADDKVFSERLSVFFDADFYLALYPDIRDRNLSPLDHYISFGWRELRKPNAWFSESMVPSDMVSTHSGSPPYVIFLTFLPGLSDLQFKNLCKVKKIIAKGHANCIQCNIMRRHFDANFYRMRYFDIRPEVDELEHFCSTGWLEKRNPSPDFDSNFYLEMNQDVAAAKINPFVHYLSSGVNEGRKPRSADPVKYELFRSLRSINNVANDYNKLHPVICLVDKNSLFIKIFSTLQSLCVSISHDDYLRHAGGVQKFIATESKESQKRGFNYLHLCPAVPSIQLVEGSEATLLINCTLNDEFFGTLTAEDLHYVLDSLLKKNSKALYAGVIHSAMGWNVSSLSKIFEPTFLHRFFYAHDYYALCPEWRLLRNNIEPCDAPDQASVNCEICAHSFNRSKHIESFSKIFKSINPKLIFPSRCAETIFKNAAPDYSLSSVTVPHMIVQNHDLHELKEIKREPKNFRIAFCGHPSAHKGFFHFSELVNQMCGIKGFDFLHFGSEDGHLIGVEFIKADLVNGISVMTSLLEEHAVDLVYVGSTWRETFNFIAYEATQAGAALISLKTSGNVADFIAEYDIGIVAEDVSEISHYLKSVDFQDNFSLWKKNVRALSFKENHSFFSEGVI